MAGCGGKKMAKGGMMKEEKMMKREGRGMAKANMQKKMAYGGKVKKMQEGGMATGNTQAEIEKLNQRIDMLRRQAAAQAQATPQRSRLGGVPGAMQALGGPQGGASFGGMKKGGKVKKMAKGGMLKTPDNPGLKKLPTEVRNKMGYMKKGGKVKPGYHKMPDGKMMKDSAHKGMKKMAKGGSVKKGCDGVATKGKTKGKMM